jgi:hypothetical protein
MVGCPLILLHKAFLLSLVASGSEHATCWTKRDKYLHALQAERDRAGKIWLLDVSERLNRIQPSYCSSQQAINHSKPCCRLAGASAARATQGGGLKSSHPFGCPTGRFPTVLGLRRLASLANHLVPSGVSPGCSSYRGRARLANEGEPDPAILNG